MVGVPCRNNFISNLAFLLIGRDFWGHIWVTLFFIFWNQLNFFGLFALKLSWTNNLNSQKLKLLVGDTWMVLSCIFNTPSWNSHLGLEDGQMHKPIYLVLKFDFFIGRIKNGASNDWPLEHLIIKALLPCHDMSQQLTHEQFYISVFNH